ncbi:MAG: HEAT repeat domain-containing protein [Candidatus Pacebacteria bacterium]|nr:HEAT repeat domain-containing protein [Candidatus Paceibacterota bacterium]
MDEYLSNLIARISTVEERFKEPGFDGARTVIDGKFNVSGYDSSKTVSWQACREAEKMANKEYVDPLINFINTEKDKQKRRAAYFVLGQIAKNSKETKAVVYLIERLGIETDRYILGSLLDLINWTDKPKEVDLDNIIKLIGHKNAIVSSSAIRALRNSNNEKVEDLLIHLLNTSEDPYVLTCVNATLNNMGTPKAIPYIEKNLKSRKVDLKISAEMAIEQIQKRSGTVN